MFSLAGNDRSAAIRVEEDPEEAVARLARVDAGEPELADALAQLGASRLRELSKQIKRALKQSRSRDRAQRRASGHVEPWVAPRARVFGD